MTIIYQHYGEPYTGPRIIEVIPSYLGLRVIFLAPMLDDAGLRNPENYNITVESPTQAYDFGCLSVTPEDAEFPSYVDLEMTDNTHGENYTLVITPGTIRDSNQELMLAGNTADFVGVSEYPEVLFVVPLSLTTVRVLFTKYMSQNADLYDKTKYVWTGGIVTLKVEEDTNSSVILTTTRQEAAAIYELTVG
jgi:hypothetical protein